MAIDWATIQGSETMRRLMRRDLESLDAVIAQVPGRTAAIQAGGNLGLYAKRLAESFATVYVAEPAPALFPILMANAPEANIVKLQAAFGFTRDLVRLEQSRQGDATGEAHEGVTHIAGPGTIPTIRIDDLALPVCDLICLDVEGYELDALMGAEETLDHCKPAVLVEVNAAIRHQGHDPESVRLLLSGRGYHRVAVYRDDELWQR